MAARLEKRKRSLEGLGGRAVDPAPIAADVTAARLTDGTVTVRGDRASRQMETRVFIGESPPVRRLLQMIKDVAPLDSPVLITGESGTGKELVAHIIHDLSARRSSPFVPINVSAVPETLLESQLFGHTKGAFTDAREGRVGLLACADKGTLFLDEIGEMPMSMQVKLLRVLQERCIRPLGGHHEIDIDFRLVCATNRDLDEAMAAGGFRRDLYYRVDVVHLELPPLRERAADILILAQHFMTTLARRLNKPVRRLSPAAEACLLEWHWPGNIRELSNCIESTVGLATSSEIGIEDLPMRIRKRRPSNSVESESLIRLDDIEKRHVLEVLRRTGGNRVRAAQLLGISRRTLYRRLGEWGVPEPTADAEG